MYTNAHTYSEVDTLLVNPVLFIIPGNQGIHCHSCVFHSKLHLIAFLIIGLIVNFHFTRWDRSFLAEIVRFVNTVCFAAYTEEFYPIQKPSFFLGSALFIAFTPLILWGQKHNVSITYLSVTV